MYCVTITLTNVCFCSVFMFYANFIYFFKNISSFRSVCLHPTNFNSLHIWTFPKITEKFQAVDKITYGSHENGLYRLFWKVEGVLDKWEVLMSLFWSGLRWHFSRNFCFVNIKWFDIFWADHDILVLQKHKGLYQITDLPDNINWVLSTAATAKMNIWSNSENKDFNQDVDIL